MANITVKEESSDDFIAKRRTKIFSVVKIAVVFFRKNRVNFKAILFNQAMMGKNIA